MSRRRAQPIGCAARGALVASGLVFVAMGLPFVWLMLGQPLWLLVRSSSWPVASCEVLFSGVQPGEYTDSGRRYQPLVAYAYTVDGREHIGAAFEPTPHGYASEELALAQAKAFAPKSRVDCYVDPADPRNAVLLRRFNPKILIGLVPGLFPLAGLLMCWAGLRMGRGQAPASSASGWLPVPPDVVAAAKRPQISLEDLQGFGDGSLKLEPDSTPLGKFFGLLIANLIWNGLTGVFVFLMWKDAGFESLAGPGLCFLVFPLVGLLLLASLPYQFMALFNPRPHVTLSRKALRPGESLSLRFELKPLGFRARRVRVLLEGREQVAAGNAGQRHVFHAATLLERAAPDSRSEGQAVLELPSGLMHSFRAGTLELAWVLRVVAEVPLFPDVEQEFALTVLPEGRRR